MLIEYNRAIYCPECDVIYKQTPSGCPKCSNKYGVSLNCIRNNAAKKLESLEERRCKIRPINNNQLQLF
jgi:hypothetical protein